MALAEVASVVGPGQVAAATELSNLFCVDGCLQDNSGQVIRPPICGRTNIAAYYLGLGLTAISFPITFIGRLVNPDGTVTVTVEHKTIGAGPGFTFDAFSVDLFVFDPSCCIKQNVFYTLTPLTPPST